MKKLLLGSMALAAMIATPAVAADMPAKAAPPPPVVLYNWTGIYAGFSVGYAWQDFDWAFNPPLLGAPNQSFSLDHNTWIFDGHGGVQVQFGWLVVGAEASYSVTSSDDWARHTGFGVGAAFAETKLHELFTAGVRLGWTPWNNWLLYVAGGYAAGLVETRNIPFAGVGIDGRASLPESEALEYPVRKIPFRQRLRGHDDGRRFRACQGDELPCHGGREAAILEGRKGEIGDVRLAVHRRALEGTGADRFSLMQGDIADPRWLESGRAIHRGRRRQDFRHFRRELDRRRGDAVRQDRHELDARYIRWLDHSGRAGTTALRAASTIGGPNRNR